MALADTDRLIDCLLAARRERRPADAAPLASVLKSADDAYLVQAAVGNELGWFDDSPPGHWKSGGASRSATLTHSPLPPAGVWPSPAEVRSWPHRLGGLEAEVALRLAVDVTPALAAALDLDGAHGLVDAMAVSIELVDSRWQQGFEAPPLLRLADQQSHAALVVGAWVPYAPRDWSVQRCEVQVADRPPAVFIGTHACGDPAWVLPDWLRFATQHGGVVPAGTVVTTGTWCGLLTGQPGERVVARFEGIGKAVVQL